MTTLLPLVVLIAVLALSVIGPSVSPYPPDSLTGSPLLPPSGAHPLGTNAIGQDLLAQFLSGARPSVVAGLIGSAISSTLALAVGLASALGRRADLVARSASDLFLAVPHLPLVILVVALAGPSLLGIALTLGLLSWPAFARVVRAQTLVELRRGHVEAARSLGMAPPLILARHLAPALAPIVAAKALLTVQYVVLAEASLAFLGLGDPTVLSWGGAISRALGYPLLFVTGAWSWWLLPPVLGIGLFVAALALLGTTLDERLSPALRALRPR